MSEIINKYDFAVLFDVENGNPNGDPDAGNMPRIDPETGNGIVTDVCIKRKIRNYVDVKMAGAEGFDIYIKPGKTLNAKDSSVMESVGIKDPKTDIKKMNNPDLAVKTAACRSFFDVRTFGAVMTSYTKMGLNCGQVRGPVQIGFAKSIDPVVPRDITITRMAVTTEKDAETKNNTMGGKSIIPYGLYLAKGYVSANLAKDTGFSEDDLNLLWEAIVNMCEDDHSALRGNMSVRKLVIFKHSSKLGDCPSYRLFDSISVRKNVEVPRKYTDYVVEIDRAQIPSSVTIEEK